MSKRPTYLGGHTVLKGWSNWFMPGNKKVYLEPELMSRINDEKKREESRRKERHPIVPRPIARNRQPK